MQFFWLYACSLSAFILFSLLYKVFVPVGKFQLNFADLWMLKFLQGLWKLAMRSLWKQPRPRSKCLLCSWYSCYLMVTHPCLHLLQLHLEWAEHQKGGRLRNVMVKILNLSQESAAWSSMWSSYPCYNSQASLFITVQLPQIYTVKTEDKHCLYGCLLGLSGKSEVSNAANC